jgi:hypothetical protein
MYQVVDVTAVTAEATATFDALTIGIAHTRDHTDIYIYIYIYIDTYELMHIHICNTLKICYIIQI